MKPDTTPEMASDQTEWGKHNPARSLGTRTAFIIIGNGKRNYPAVTVAGTQKALLIQREFAEMPDRMQ